MIFYTVFSTGQSSRLVLCCIFLLIVPGLFWGLPSAITPQVDAPLPIGPLLFFAEYAKPHLNTVYPAFHQVLLLPLYAAVIAFFKLTGALGTLSSGWPYGFRDATFFFSVLIVVTNLVSAVMGVLLLRLALGLVSLPERAWAWAGLLIIGTNGVFVYYSRTGNLDMPYVFWWGVCLFFLRAYFFESQSFRSTLLPAAAAAALSAGSKDQASGLVIGAGLLVLLIAPAKTPSSFGLRVRNSAKFFALLAAFYAVAAILPHPVRWWHHARFVVSPHAPTQIPLTPAGEVEILLITLRILASVYSIPVLALAAAGGAWLFRQRRTRELWFLLLPLLTYYAIIIGKTRVCYPRFVVPFLIPALVLTTYGAADIARRLSPRMRRGWAACIGLLLAVQFTLSYIPVTYAQVFDLKRTVSAELPAFVPKREPLLVSHMQSYNFPNRDVYDNYRLMMLPGDPIVPPSRHAGSVFHPLDERVQFFLLGSGTAGLPTHIPGKYPHIDGTPVREWRYPQWVKDHVLVPCIYEFTLYRRNGPLPLESRPPAQPPRPL